MFSIYIIRVHKYIIHTHTIHKAVHKIQAHNNQWSSIIKFIKAIKTFANKPRSQ
jgi:hypothetical protein